jgi:putative hydrolase of the HAD superfamily
MKDKDAIFKRHIHPLIPIPTGVATALLKMQRFSAMLFDVYGTLLISGAGEIGLNRRPIERMDDLQGLLDRYDIGHTPQSLKDALDRAIEKTHLIRWRQGIDSPEVDIVRIWQQVLGLEDILWVKNFALEYELLVNPVYPMPGIEELLLACTTRKMAMGIISNAQFYTVDVLERFLGATLGRRGFDQRLLFFSWREGYAKPSNFMFDRAKEVLSGMGIPAASVLYVVNDMRNDILPAMEVGFKTALFAGDRRSLRQRESDGRCKDISPDLIVTDLRQLIAGTGNS